MAEENLEALCDLLDEDDSFDAEISNLVDEEFETIEEKQDEGPQPQKSPEIPAQPPGNISSNPSTSYVNEMEAKMKKMQEEMARMQHELQEAKGGNNSQQPQPPSQIKKKTLQEIDVFGAGASQSASNAPRSPVKTNPFAEQVPSFRILIMT